MERDCEVTGRLELDGKAVKPRVTLALSPSPALHPTLLPSSPLVALLSKTYQRSSQMVEYPESSPNFLAHFSLCQSSASQL